VIDKEGNLVTDLEAQDFQIYEDGRPQRIDLFGRAQDGGLPLDPRTNQALVLDLGLLMDTSESMLHELKLSQEAAVRFLEAVPRARDLVTIFFDQDIQLSRFDGEQQQGLVKRIQSIKGGGWTALYDAIAVYLSRADDSGSGRKVLVLFTDGEDSKSATTLGEVIKLVRGSPVTVYAIAFSQGLPQSRRLPAKAFLQGLAEMTGGEVFSPVSFRDLPGIYDKILRQLSAQYVIGYVSDNAKRDGKYRRIKLELSEPSLHVRHREGYLAGEPKTARKR
jgi:Ca-activated chloride channel family protein